MPAKAGNRRPLLPPCGIFKREKRSAKIRGEKGKKRKKLLTEKTAYPLCSSAFQRFLEGFFGRLVLVVFGGDGGWFFCLLRCALYKSFFVVFGRYFAALCINLACFFVGCFAWLWACPFASASLCTRVCGGLFLPFAFGVGLFIVFCTFGFI